MVEVELGAGGGGAYICSDSYVPGSKRPHICPDSFLRLLLFAWPSKKKEYFIVILRTLRDTCISLYSSYQMSDVGSSRCVG